MTGTTGCRLMGTTFVTLWAAHYPGLSDVEIGHGAAVEDRPGYVNRLAGSQVGPATQPATAQNDPRAAARYRVDDALDWAVDVRPEHHQHEVGAVLRNEVLAIGVRA